MVKWIAAALAACVAATAPAARAATVVVDPIPVNGKIVDASGQIDCGLGMSQCSGTYPGSASEPGGADLQAVAGAGYTFQAWQGLPCSSQSGDTCSMVFTSNVTRTVSATFADVTPPSVSVTAPVAGTVYGSNQMVQVGASASDGTGIVNRVEFTASKSGSGSAFAQDPTAPYTGAWSSSTFADGTWTVVARAYDGAGNWADSAPRTFVVDRTAPTLSVTGPGDHVNAKPQVVTFTAGADAVERRCYVDGSQVQSCTSATSHQTEFDAGQHSVGVAVRDAAGNWTPINTVTFTVDRTLPTVTIGSPDENALTNATSLPAAFTADGTGSGLAAVECALDDGAYSPCASASSHTFTSVPEGRRTLKVRVTDQAGNSALATRTVTVDRTGPSVVVTGPGEGASVAAEPVVVSFSTSDPSGIASRTCAYDGTAAVACSDAGTHTVAGLGAGTRTFTLAVTDTAGNTTTVTRSFTIVRGGGGGGGGGSTPTIAASVEATWRVAARFTVLTGLRAVDVPAGAAVQIRCKGRGCPFKRRAVANRGRTVALLGKLRRRRLMPGVVVEVHITRPGAIGKVVRITIRRKKRPALTRLCLRPGAAKPGAC